MTSNPRNHVNNNLAYGFAEASGGFSVWPGELGLAAQEMLSWLRNSIKLLQRMESFWNPKGFYVYG